MYALYRFGLWTGHYRRSTPIEGALEPEQLDESGPYRIASVLRLPDAGTVAAVLGDQAMELVREADEIASGQVRLYGGPPVPLELALPGSPQSLRHWTETERGKNHWQDGRDIKDIWEPARFGWAFVLGRAYHLTQKDGYAQAFWQYAGQFLRANPPNLGPHWASGQEVALRLIALVFASQAFSTAPATTPGRRAWLGRAVAAHARRIPPTLVYARSQNNNHLVTEAAGLFTAGLALPGHPDAPSWREQGWKWLNHALQSQIAPDGSYTQHSTNYHRLVLHAALWVNALLDCQGESYPAATLDRLAAATSWLADQLDPTTGQVPNLGSNDGANILPLSSSPFHDYRPVISAASEAFLGKPGLPGGAWDELGHMAKQSRAENRESRVGSNSRLPVHEFSTLDSRRSRLSTLDSWGSLRAVRFSGRPAHADQLHVELWWRGLNIAQDAGTYRYNAPPPWDNALARTLVHNTIEVDGQDQMRRAGRFLWLDWAQAEVTAREFGPDGAWEKVTARHNGYARLGIIHERSLERRGERQWLVTDRLLPVPGHPASQAVHAARLHWLLPDWEWELDGTILRLSSPFGTITISIRCEGMIPPGDQAGGSESDGLQVQLVRGGERLAGTGSVDPIQGWVSPTYSIKQPALSLAVQAVRSLPVMFITNWDLP